MGNFNKDIYMEGCRLVTRIYGDTTDMYQFVFNPETAEFSDIVPCSARMEFEIEKDGWYRVVTFKRAGIRLINGALDTGYTTYTAEYIMDHIESEQNDVWNPEYIGEYEIDETFSICKLKKCLAELESKTFQDMLKNCGKVICKNDEVKSQRDFLFIAVWLIEHYIELGKIEMARAIYDRMKGCGDICKNLLNDKRSCGCDG